MRFLWAVPLLVALSASVQSVGAENRIAMSTTETQAQLAQSHPSELYLHAQKLFQAGYKDEAVIWFYIGQLRFRYHLLVHPELPPDGEPALMASFNEVLGREINEWAGGSTVNWAASIRQALEWDVTNPNGVTPKEQYGAQLQELRIGLSGLAQYVTDNADMIRAQRSASGLQNR
jgi:hypothetical protein